jgi:putative endonuclease
MRTKPKPTHLTNSLCIQNLQFAPLSEAKDLVHRVPSYEQHSPLRKYYVYIMSNQSRTLYVGMTNNLERRVYEHKHKLSEGFTSRYNITKLVWFAETEDVRDAIAREKEIKGWLRTKKKTLIEETNPEWQDLSTGWYA